MKRLPLLILGLAVGLAAAAFALRSPSEAVDKPLVTVYKSPTCGCCSKWVDHLEANGYAVETQDMNNVMPMKQRLGLPAQLASCHTAVVGGYVVEGHVPSDVIDKLLEEKPEIVGIAVPGMPIGSPGMEGPNPESYDILAFTKDGNQSVYASR